MKPTENTCTECGITKPMKQFYKHPGMATGYYSQCKMCMAQNFRNRRIAKSKPDPINGLLRKWGRA